MSCLGEANQLRLKYRWKWRPYKATELFLCPFILRKKWPIQLQPRVFNSQAHAILTLPD